MSETPAAPRLATTYAEVEDALLSRWPETKLEPTLDRIRAFTELLGDPQAGYPVIHLTGTNGKTSTSRMVDTLLRALDLRTGRFTSPHVERMSERISIDGVPLDDDAFVRAFNDVAPYTHLVDGSEPYPLSFFETVVGMAYAAFADAPVDVAIVEVGMGGAWDATNVADGVVATVLPVAIDHAKYLGDDPVGIAVEKAGIIKPGVDRGARRADAGGHGGAAGSCRGGRRAGGPRGARLRGGHPQPGGGRPGGHPRGGSGVLTRTSSCRCTARTRRRTRPSRSRRSRPSRVTNPLTRTWCGRRSPR